MINLFVSATSSFEELRWFCVCFVSPKVHCGRGQTFNGIIGLVYRRFKGCFNGKNGRVNTGRGTRGCYPNGNGHAGL